MNQKHRLFYFTQISILSLALLFTSACAGNLSGGDNFLFGLSEAIDRVFGDEEVVACTSDVTVTTKAVSLVEDGNVAATFSTSEDSGFTKVVTAGPNEWGFTTFETCVYPNLPISGSVEIPVTVNATYGARVTSRLSYTAGAVSDLVIPTTLSFTGNGTAARQCFRFTRVDDGDRNPVVSPMTINLGTMVQKSAGGEVVSGTYSGKDACDISVTLDDDEAPGIRVSNISDIMEEPGVATPNSATFLVVLRTAPTANVTIPINDTFDSLNANNREGTASPTSLTFTTGNWNLNQTVTVTSNDDLELDGLKVYTIQLGNTVSSDSEYNGLNPRDVVIYNRDQSVPGYSYTRFGAGPEGTTGAAGGTITGFATDENNQFGNKYSNMQLKLRTKPTANVTLTFSSNCGTKCTILVPTLTFTPENWNTYQTFRVEGASDAASSGNQDYNVTFVASSTDTTYNTTVTEPVFSVRSCDNDVTTLIQPCNFSGSPLGTSGGRLSATEGGSTQIWLISRTSPASTVTVGLTSSDLTEGTVPASVTIDSNNFNVMESGSTNRIALTHADDTIVDGPQSWTVVTASSTGGLSYDSIDIFATTVDNENYFYVNRTGSTQEGTTNAATIDVCLGANNPDEAITVTVACTTYTAGEAAFGECGTLSTTSLVFPINSQVDQSHATNAGCSNSPLRQTVTVQGADDTYADGSQSFTVNLTMVANGDSGYSAASQPSDPSVSNADNEPVGRRVFVTSGTYNGEMTAQGVFGADNICNTNRTTGNSGGTYKAMIVSNSGGEVTNDRLAGGTNWTLTAGRHYYRCTGTAYSDCSDEHTRLFIANGSGTFSFPMSRDFSTNINDEFWTGMQTNLSPETQTSTPTGTCVDAGTVYRHNCHGFTYQTCPTNGGVSFYGQIWKNNGSGSIVSNEAACTASKKLICVEQ